MKRKKAVPVKRWAIIHKRQILTGYISRTKALLYFNPATNPNAHHQRIARVIIKEA